MTRDHEIQLQFPTPGVWDQFTLTAVSCGTDGFVQTGRFTQDDLSEERKQAFSRVVSAISVLSDEWKALQAWARLNRMTVQPPCNGEEGPANSMEAVVLTVEAVNMREARRVFTSVDYAEFTIPDEAAVDFFKYFITNNE